MDYQGYKLIDKIMLVCRDVSEHEDSYGCNRYKTCYQAYLVDPSNKKQLESARHWAKWTEYGPKIQKGGGLYREDVSFILFDVYISGNYQSRETVEDVARSFGVDVVPIILEGTIDAGVAFVKSNPKSTIGTAEMEGLVGRPKVEMRDRCGKRVIVKIKWEDFK